MRAFASFRPRHLLVVAAATVLTGAAHDRYAPERWALVIGIGDYRNFSDEVGGDLPGAVNDAKAFRDAAVARLGVPPDHVHMVLDLDATRARLESEMTEWLPSVAGPRDLVWIFYAGHGSQVWDTDGDEEDGLEETICPTDVLRGSPDVDILDDDIGRWLAGIPAADVVVVWDKCHAESSTRSATPFALPRALGREPEKDLPKPEGYGLLREARAHRGYGDRIASRPSEQWLGERAPNVLEIAASRSDEVAVDARWPGAGGAPARFGGAFTTNFVRELWQAPAGTSLQAVFDRTAEDLRAQRFAQQPALGDAALRSRSLGSLSGSADAAGGGGIPVTAVNGNSVTLGGGGNAGVTVGSILEAGGSLLRVDAVGGESLKATVAGRAPGAPSTASSLRAGSRATLTAYAYPPSELRVSLADVPADARGAMVAALRGVAGLRLVTQPGEYADLLVRRTDGGWVVLGLDGFARHVVRAATPAAAAAALAPILRKEAQAAQIASLDNPADPFGLEFTFNHPNASFGVGDLVEFHVKSERPGYLTIVDMGTDGTVTVLFPNSMDGENHIEAGQAFVLPTPAMGTEFRATPPAGRGIVRAFVTERKLPLTLDADDPNLGQDVLRALGRAVGDPPVAGSDAMPVGEWATASIVYEVTE